MTAKVIQGFFVGGRPRLPSPVAQPTAMSRLPGPPVPAFAGRPPVAQPRMPGPPAPAFAGRPPGPPTPAFAARPPVAQRHGSGGAFPVDPGQLGLASGGGRPLPDAVRGKMEAALGASFDDVRVHVGPQAERIGAIAFTVGSDIYFAPGRFQPATVHGQQLLGHELAHVVQQRAGRVRNPLGAGLAVVQDHALEAEADRLGHRAAILDAQPVPSPIGNPSSIVAQNQRSRQNAAANDTRNIGNRADKNLGASQRESGPVQRMRTIQRRPIHTAQITGVTHLREVQNKSLVRGNDYAEVKFPETVTIDKGDRWNSHLGINLSQTPSPNNLWYRVLSYRGNSISDREIYIRGEMIKDVGLAAEELLIRMAQPKTFPVPEIEIQKDIVTRLESKSTLMPHKENGEIAENFLLGGIVLPVSTDVVQLMRKAKFVMLKESMVKFDGQDMVSNDEYLQKKIVQNMMTTLLQAGQLQYLARSGLSNSQWRIFVEIHYYRARAQDVSSFHKDTVGRTLFVNLNYTNEHEIAGPEYVINPLPAAEHDKAIKSSLPNKFLQDVDVARTHLKQPTKIGATRVPAHGVVSFVDELIHHMTPYYGHRTVHYQNVINFLQRKWGNDKYANAVALYEEFESSKDKILFFNSRIGEHRILINVVSLLVSAGKSSRRNTFDRKQLADTGLASSLIDELIDTQSDKPERFRTVYIPGMTTRPYVVARGTPPLKRTMSEWALRGKIPPKVTGDRRFFRSNVQVIEATKLGKIVDEATLKKLKVVG